MQIRHVALALCAVTLAVCGGTEPEDPQLASIAVTSEAGASTLMLGQTLQLTAEGKDQDGDIFEVEAFTWSSSNTAVATVDDNGLVEYGGGTSPYAAFAANVMVEEDIGAFMTSTTLRFSQDCGVVRRSPLITWSTDFTASQHNNTFSNNARTQCGP